MQLSYIRLLFSFPISSLKSRFSSLVVNIERICLIVINRMPVRIAVILVSFTIVLVVNSYQSDPCKKACLQFFQKQWRKVFAFLLYLLLNYGYHWNKQQSPRKWIIPGTMEVQGLTNQAEYDRIRALTKVTSPDAAKKIAGFLNKVSHSIIHF